jgi:hypothetical protein
VNLVGGTPLRYLREEIEAAFREGATLEDVEREIVDAAFIAEDRRASLWLFAWGVAERGGSDGAGLPEIVSGVDAR